MEKIFYCEHCQKCCYESQLDSKSVCYESMYGVSSDFSSRTYGEIGVCPHCGSDDINEIEREDLKNYLFDLYEDDRLNIDFVEELNK